MVREWSLYDDSCLNICWHLLCAKYILFYLFCAEYIWNISCARFYVINTLSIKISQPVNCFVQIFSYLFTHKLSMSLSFKCVLYKQHVSRFLLKIQYDNNYLKCLVHWHYCDYLHCWIYFPDLFQYSYLPCFFCVLVSSFSNFYWV